MGEPPVMHHDRVLIPEVDGRQVAGENLLRFNVIGATAGRVLDVAMPIMPACAAIKEKYPAMP